MRADGGDVEGFFVGRVQGSEREGDLSFNDSEGLPVNNGEA